MDSFSEQCIITSASQNDFRIPTVDPLEAQSRFADIVSAIARTRRLMILCGDAASHGAEMPSLDTPVPVNHDGMTRKLSVRNLLKECSPAHVRPEELQASKLSAYNRAMTDRRAAARRAPDNMFLRYLGLLHDKGHLVTCVTTSFDGFEADVRDGISDKIVELYGSNKTLRCSTRACSGLTSEETMALDERMLAEGTAPYTKTSKARRTGTEATRALRPALQDTLTVSMEIGDGRTQLVQAAESCQLLLIVGAPWRTPELAQLTSDLSSAVREKYGGVILIDDERPAARLTCESIDLQLPCEVEIVLSQLVQSIQQPRPESQEDETLAGEGDFWFEVLNNELARHVVPPLAPYSGKTCLLCSCTIQDYLVDCTKCSVVLCHRREPDDPLKAPDVGGLVSEQLADLHLQGDGDGKVKAGTSAGIDLDMNPYDEGCVGFNAFDFRDSRPSIEEAKAEFVCDECWDYADLGLYPHQMRARRQEREERADRPPPRLAVVVYYVEQFWPQAKHICKRVAEFWRQCGYQCTVEPVKLEHISEKKVVFKDLSWEPRSYEVMVVYLTHGLTGEQGYQVAHGQALRPAKFLEFTLQNVRTVLAGAASRRGFLVCCGHPLLHPGLVSELREHLDRSFALDSLVGCLNKKLSPAYLANLVTMFSYHLIEVSGDAKNTLHRTWMTESIACSHSDLLYMAPGRAPEMWLYAPFQSRPLGKPLPSVFSVCPCPNPIDPASGKTHARKKIWKVEHEGRPGCKLRDVKVKAICQGCRQAWPLPYESLQGTLVRVADVYGAVVPYFYEPIHD
ncbi:hypothetical protein FRC09_009790 [Ceratobasidium sp. 395]|nr:hypothetical protein FRC09_009790 [Ceratobasidium sp. 395]